MQTEFIDDKQNNNRCDKCSVVFRSERALKSHRVKKCRIRQDMSAEEQAKLRRKREANESIAGRKIPGVEQIRIVDALGKLLQAVAEFKYLGTMVYGRSLDKRNKQTTGNSSRNNGLSEQTLGGLGDLTAS